MFDVIEHQAVLVVCEANTGRSFEDSDNQKSDLRVKRDRDRSVDLFSKNDLIEKPGTYRVDVNGAEASVEFDVFENNRVSKFRFFGEDKSGSNDPYFYISTKNGSRIIRYLSGKTELEPALGSSDVIIPE